MRTDEKRLQQANLPCPKHGVIPSPEETHGSLAAGSTELPPTYRINPLTDPRWPELVATHPRASVFHTSGWLDALRRTYGYIPSAFTTSPPNKRLGNAAVYASVDSWISGSRMVSLPFSDHCELLADTAADADALFLAQETGFRKGKYRYFEIRPTSSFLAKSKLLCASEELYLHKIDLSPDLDAIFRQFHRSSTQRKVSRAEREKLSVREGRSNSLLKDFYKLTVLTRRRHGVPPQPVEWFRNLLDCLGGSANIMVAYSGDRPVASIFTLRHRDTLTYKYGCSDAKFHNLGGTHLLFWRAIQGAKHDGLRVFDLGRSTVQNQGLIKFKERWGAKRSSLFYLTFTAAGMASRVLSHSGTDWKVRYAKHFFSYAPNAVLSLAGRVLYRHIG